MDKRIGAVISAAITLTVFTALPLFAPRFMPPELSQMLGDTGLDIEVFLNQIAMMGVVAAALTLAKGFVDEVSVISLAIALIQNGVTLVITFLFLGLGSLGSLGATTITVELEEAVNVIVLDMRLFIQITAVTVVLRMIQAFLVWNEARDEAKPPGRIVP